jgi:hypothetical protein
MLCAGRIVPADRPDCGDGPNGTDIKKDILASHVAIGGAWVIVGDVGDLPAHLLNGFDRSNPYWLVWPRNGHGSFGSCHWRHSRM